MATTINKMDPAAEAMKAVIRLFESAERRHKEQIQDTIDALKAHGGRALVNEYRYVFRNEAEMEGYGKAIAAINRHTKDGITPKAVHSALAGEIEGIKSDLLIGLGADRSTCPVRGAQQAVCDKAMLVVLDNLTLIKAELEASEDA